MGCSLSADIGGGGNGGSTDSGCGIFIDGACIKASANLKKKMKQEVPAAAKSCMEDLLAEVSADRGGHGKNPLNDGNVHGSVAFGDDGLTSIAGLRLVCQTQASTPKNYSQSSCS